MMSKYDLLIDPPLMNAAGTLGFAPDWHNGLNLDQFGVFITNPVSLQPRMPAQSLRYISHPGGFLLHTGYPNPGLKAVLREYAAAWQRSRLAVIVHLLPQSPADVVQMLAILEESRGVSGVEIGLPPGISAQNALDFADAAQGVLPFILRLPLERAVELFPFLDDCGAEAISFGPPRGVLPAADGILHHGRLYGPGLFPLMLATLEKLSEYRTAIIAAGGIYSTQQAQAAMRAGARAVQLDAILWRQWGILP